ncbi:hypothetical protein HPP92_011552 [Vanilla planifolia]|uniref:Uncharacterized protein n=1 Tax=Vanilla planifolia TaxID=51239 RepID=A0A835QXT8_VANPL|nr:hypothetical protein HPP92_011552 [Vanilla planifolia]
MGPHYSRVCPPWGPHRSPNKVDRFFLNRLWWGPPVFLASVFCYPDGSEAARLGSASSAQSSRTGGTAGTDRVGQATESRRYSPRHTLPVPFPDVAISLPSDLTQVSAIKPRYSGAFR